jgi:uncharacterized membrane protein YukC
MLIFLPKWYALVYARHTDQSETSVDSRAAFRELKKRNRSVPASANVRGETPGAKGKEQRAKSEGQRAEGKERGAKSKEQRAKGKEKRQGTRNQGLITKNQ